MLKLKNEITKEIIMKKYVLIASALSLALGTVVLTACSKKAEFTGDDYSIPTIDLSVMPEEIKGTKLEYLYELSVVDNSKDYVAHPDSVLLKNGNISPPTLPVTARVQSLTK